MDSSPFFSLNARNRAGPVVPPSTLHSCLLCPPPPTPACPQGDPPEYASGVQAPITFPAVPAPAVFASLTQSIPERRAGNPAKWSAFPLTPKLTTCHAPSSLNPASSVYVKVSPKIRLGRPPSPRHRPMCSSTMPVTKLITSSLCSKCTCNLQVRFRLVIICRSETWAS